MLRPTSQCRRAQRRRLHGGGVPPAPSPPCNCTVVGHFATKNVTIDRRQNFIEQRVERLRRQIAEVGLLPRHDVQHLRQLAIAGDDRRVEIEAIAARARAPRGRWLVRCRLCRRRTCRLAGAAGVAGCFAAAAALRWRRRPRRLGRKHRGTATSERRQQHHDPAQYSSIIRVLALRGSLPSRFFSSVTQPLTFASGGCAARDNARTPRARARGCCRYRSHSTPRFR